MITYVYYTHTDYLDVISISTDRIKDYSNKILLINKNNMDLQYLYDKYKKVIFYDDSLPYTWRLYSTISSLEMDYALVINDTDAIIKKDDEAIEKLYQLAVNKNIDRIDLQYQNINVTPDTKYIDFNIREMDYKLIRQNSQSPYAFNVNPSIWKLSSYIKLLEKFKNSGYREIEHHAQQYCHENFEIYKCNGKYVNMGWMAVMPFFQCLHVTKGGKFLPPFNNNIQSKYVIDEWHKIIKNYRLPGNRGWHLHRRIEAYQSRDYKQDNMFK